MLYVILSAGRHAKPPANLLGEVMVSAARAFGLAIIVASAVLSGAVAADEIHQRALDTSIPNDSMSAPTASDGSPAKSSSADDLSSRIDQLEANRAAVDGKTKSPISLGISGWVSQQVTVTHQ